MNKIKLFIWKLIKMTPWVFRHAYHAPDHQVNGSSIEKNFKGGYFRCRKCQACLAVPARLFV